MFDGLDIFNDCARRCPHCRSTTFYGASYGAETLTCTDCGRVVRSDELTDPDWKVKRAAPPVEEWPDTI